MGCTSIFRFALALALFVAWWAVDRILAVRAISITFTIGGTQATGAWPAGPDYATDVLGDPWDFSNAEDISIDPNETINWTGFAVSGGLAGGTTATGDAYLTTLYRGYYDTLISATRNGRLVPIDSAKYQKLSFRMIDEAGGSQPQVYWYHYPGGADPGDPSGGGNFGVKIINTTLLGSQIWIRDLTESQTAGSAWTDGVVRGFRLDPNDGGHSGHRVFLDWIRLTPNDGHADAAKVTIGWSGCFGTAATLTVLDASGTAYTIAAGQTGSSYTWNYGVLPPGSYTMRVSCSAAGTQDQSFTINSLPLIQPTEPDITGGEDFATAVLGNAWDMDSAADIQASDGMTTPIFSGGILTATNTGTAGDPNITLLTSDVGKTIDTSRYHLLTVRFQIDGAFDVGAGSIARVLWGSGQFFGSQLATTTKDVIVWPGMNSYTVDLDPLATGKDNGLESTGTPEVWTNGAKTFFRFDPHEFQSARQFHVDDIRLAATDETVNNSFTIKWTGGDADGGNPSVALYYDADTDPASKTLIASGLVMSQLQYDWNTSSVPTGLYYIYAEANDGQQTYGRYSTGKVRVVRPNADASPLMDMELPLNGGTVLQPFNVTGWAIDKGAATGTGVDQVRIKVTPAGGATTTLGDATIFVRRDDIGAAHGSQFINSGFTRTVTGLSPGTYTFTAEAHSTVTGTFNQSDSATVTLPATDPQMEIETPFFDQTVGPTFTLSGWAIDRGDPTTPGIVRVQTYAFPINADGTVGSGIYLGQAAYGSARSDVGSTYGSRFANSGFSLAVSTLAPGRYRLVAYAESKVELGKSDQRSVDVTVSTSARSVPMMSIDGPTENATVYQPFLTGGWAVDRGAATDSGVDAIHVWAFPLLPDGGVDPDSSHWKFVAQGLGGGLRADVGAVFGAQFNNSGFTFIVQGLAPGNYILVVYARSTVTGTFNQDQRRKITIKDTDQYMSIDGPTEGSVVLQPFLTGGWALDLASKDGSGIGDIHVWAYPIVNGAPDVDHGIFVVQGKGGGYRPDVGDFYGRQFDNSGFTFVVDALPKGDYLLGVYALTSVKPGAFQAQFRNIRIE